MAAEDMEAAAAAEYSHRAVWPLLVADKVVGSEHHLADVTVKAGFMPVLREEKKEFECDFTYKWVKRGYKLMVFNFEEVHSLAFLTRMISDL